MTLKNRRTIEGKITRQDDRGVAIAMEGGEVIIATDQINFIEKKPFDTKTNKELAAEAYNKAVIMYDEVFPDVIKICKRTPPKGPLSSADVYILKSALRKFESCDSFLKTSKQLDPTSLDLGRTIHRWWIKRNVNKYRELVLRRLEEYEKYIPEKRKDEYREERAPHPSIRASDVTRIDMVIRDVTWKNKEPDSVSGLMIFLDKDMQQCAVNAGIAKVVIRGAMAGGVNVLDSFQVNAPHFIEYGNDYGYPFEFKCDGRCGSIELRWDKFSTPIPRLTHRRY